LLGDKARFGGRFAGTYWMKEELRRRRARARRRRVQVERDWRLHHTLRRRVSRNLNDELKIKEDFCVLKKAGDF